MATFSPIINSEKDLRKQLYLIVHNDLNEVDLNEVKSMLTLQNEKSLSMKENYATIRNTVDEFYEMFGCEDEKDKYKHYFVKCNPIKRGQRLFSKREESDAERFARYIKLAAANSVAMALNYASGIDVKAGGKDVNLEKYMTISGFYYPQYIEGGKCRVGFYVNKAQSQTKDAYRGLNFVNQYDLDKFNISDVSIIEIKGGGRDQASLSYESQLLSSKGLSLSFMCDSSKCNVDGLRRVWNSVAKTCKGENIQF
jgi:hypothetical protein